MTIQVILNTTANGGDHLKEIKVAISVDPKITLENLMLAAFEGGLKSIAQPNKFIDFIELRYCNEITYQENNLLTTTK